MISKQFLTKMLAQAVFFVALYFTTVLIMDRFFRREPVAHEQERQAQSMPLDREIDFIDTKRAEKQEFTKVQTAWGSLLFSSDGATLERLTLKRADRKDKQNITTIFPSTGKEDKCFLVALAERTPYFYHLTERIDGADTTTLVYEGDYGEGLVRKQFVIDQHAHKIDLMLTFIAHKGASTDYQLQARVLLPAPNMTELADQQVQAVFANTKGSLEKVMYDKLDWQQSWCSPTLFGVENRYMIHALVHDAQRVVARGYYMRTPQNHVITVLQTAQLSATADQHEPQVSLSFYCGPKEAAAMRAVAPLLEESLDYYGIFAPLSRLLLKLLNILYDYVHNYGLAILLLTLIIKLLLAPFVTRGERSMRKSKDHAAKMQYIQQKYKHDPERMRLEQAEFIRKHGMPQLVGCLPILLQIPIFFALNRLLSNAYQLYQAPFFGWITDLSSPDPYYLLPVLITIVMLVRALTGDAQQRSMMLVAAILFGAFAANFAAGLVLYLVASSMLDVTQSWLQTHMGKA